MRVLVQPIGIDFICDDVTAASARGHINGRNAGPDSRRTSGRPSVQVQKIPERADPVSCYRAPNEIPAKGARVSVVVVVLLLLSISRSPAPRDGISSSPTRR